MKITRALLILTAFAVVAFLFISSSSTPDREMQKPKNETIVAFGDSLTTGVGTTAGFDYVSILSKQVKKPIIRIAKNGDTTALALARIDQVLEKDPGVVIVLLGGNDILRGVPLATTQKNLETIIEKLQAKGSRVILLGVRGGLITDPYAAMYAALAKKYRTEYVPDVLRNIIGNEAYMADLVHPNDAGHDVIAHRVLPTLEKVLGI